MRKGGLEGWRRAYEAAQDVASPDTWHATLAKTVREASGSSFATVISCAPGNWYCLHSASYPHDYNGLVSMVRDRFLHRIDQAGEGWDYAVREHGLVYAPLEVSKNTDVASDLRKTLRSSFDIRGYVCSFILDQQQTLVGMVVVGHEVGSRALLEATHDELTELSRAAGDILGFAMRIARQNGAVMPAETAGVTELTPREREIAILAAHGFSVLNISAKLGLANGTVNTHLHRIYRKLSVHNRAELAQRMLAFGDPSLLG